MSVEAVELFNLEQRVLKGRAYGTLSEAEMDTLLDRMDVLWPLLTEAERVEVCDRAKQFAKMMESPSLVEWDRPPLDKAGHPQLPRTPLEQ